MEIALLGPTGTAVNTVVPGLDIVQIVLNNEAAAANKQVANEVVGGT